MQNEIVHVMKGDVYTTSVIVAEMLGVFHKDLLRTIEKIVKKLNSRCAVQHTMKIKFPQKFIESTFKIKNGNTYPMYEMNESAYLLLAMQLGKYENAFQVQLSIIEAFQLMKRQLIEQHNATWIAAREQGKETRLAETDVIKEFVEYATKQGSTHAKFYYANITKMTNKALELLLQSTHGKPMRNLANVQQLGFIGIIENHITAVIEESMKKELHYKHIYDICKDEVNRLVDSLDVRKRLS